ncbi:sodium/myo-inositol cotransporter 2 [Callorhinchus milii]|uniref:sodium/myo-inositol cotransporter 2 n=1 Tax=Callorhinchus milii TaxID=7868 RepID=UPI001C3FE675|nr:sodium/myo-inositol cotransporter 2 [Callorhinchus milii]
MAMSSPTPTTVPPPDSLFPSSSLTVVDIVVLVLYFVFVLVVGLWSMCRTKRSTVQGYFLAGKTMLWWPVGASLFASNVGSGHFVGLAGTGAASGIAVAAYELNGMFSVLLLGWLFLPIYITAGVTTMPEYLERRYRSPRIRLFIAVVYLFIYIFTKISVDIYAGAIFIQQALHWDLYIAVAGLLLITALYTVGGGLAAVIYTDALQTVIMLVGALTLTGFCFARVGGLEGLRLMYPESVPRVRDTNTSCGLPRDDAFHIFRHPVTSDFPWPGVVLGMAVPSLWYWCTDQVIVQRSLSAKSMLHAKGGSLFAAYLKILPLFIMVIPGMVSRVLFPDEVACANPDECQRLCGNSVGCTDIAYPKLVMELLPGGLRGLMMAVMVAALMSSLTSIFNSSSTIFTMDLWLRFRPHCTEWELMVIGRVFVLVLVLVSVLWIPLVQASQGGQLFIYIQSISSYLQPPIAIVFIAGCFWPRANEKAAFWGLLAGILLGCVRMVLDFIYEEPVCGQPDTRPDIVRCVHYLHFSIILSLFTLIMVVSISLCTEAPSPESVRQLTWFSRYEDPEHQPAPEPPPQEIPSSSSDTDGGRGRCWWLLACVLWFCGMDKQQKRQQVVAVRRSRKENMELLWEEPGLRNLANASLLLCLSAAVFLFAYFG